MNTYIYARVSTETQNIESQVISLCSKYKVPEENVFAEKLSGKSLSRPVFQTLKETVKSGDAIVVQDLSRLGRNTTEVLDFIEKMKGLNVGLIIDDLGRVDVTSATGKLVVTTLAAVATMQREQILEKQAVGIARAREQGKFKGRQQSPETIKKCRKAFILVNTHNLTKEDAARASGIGIATFYRFLRSVTKKELHELLSETKLP
ncbi:recombinase family protein [Alteromonadaceae bacterium M269]|nr:recombinase family protein [Alteromonadaceae bacterium M269]